MRCSAAFLSILGGLILAGSAWGAGQSDIEGCDQGGDRARRIESCSRLIDDPSQSATARAVAYNNRGNALRAKGENDRALADFSEAIKLRADGTYFYNRGNAYRTKGDNERAIADYNEAIRIDPNDWAAHTNRGNAYREEGQLDRAIGDYDIVIRLKPTARVIYHRGEAYRLKGEDARAIADYDEAIRLNPKHTLAFFGRGQIYLYNGSSNQAAADLTRANELNPKFPYGVLWREIGERRSASKSSLAQTSTQTDMTAWPAPIIRLFLGQESAEAVLAAANSDPETREVRVCEARFYIGELLLPTAPEQARRMFGEIVEKCRHTVVEWEAAKAELKAAGLRR